MLITNLTPDTFLGISQTPALLPVPWILTSRRMQSSSELKQPWDGLCSHQDVHTCFETQILTMETTRYSDHHLTGKEVQNTLVIFGYVQESKGEREADFIALYSVKF